MTKKIYFPNLDGLRTLAFLAVFLLHSFYTNHEYILSSDTYFLVTSFFSKGEYGVDLFFVLSGFLITYLLLSEEDLNNKFSIRQFYIRRILRIWPLYFACVIYGFLIEPQIMLLFGKTPNPTADPLLFVTFLSNFNTIINGTPEAQNLPVLWSVAIEEQFYFVWPLLMVLVAHRRLVLCVLLIIVSVVFRYFYFDQKTIIEFHTLSVMSDLLVGCIIGILSFRSSAFINYFRDLEKWKIVSFYIIGICLIAFDRSIATNAIGVAIIRLATSFFFAFAILEQNYAQHSFYKMGNYKLLTASGKYTYGLYCLHMIGITAGKEICLLLQINNDLMGVLVWQTLISFVLSVALAVGSYHLLEVPFLRLKSRFSFISTHRLA